ncbi:MAG: hypothetical protein GXP31_10060 [Kiritimatiellaeota bacterium]|nr:hypothetical protein [Kiritimatiellota bacterium]
MQRSNAVSRFAAGLIVVSVCGLRSSAQQLRFEAEDYSTPKDAWVRDRFAPDKWNLWSTDRDAKKKWSGGVVLQSPPVKADRQSPAEGAPPLHTRLTGIPAGAYNVSLKSGRVLAVSLDGRTWKRYTGGALAVALRIDDGTFDLWVDDRYAMPEPKQRGSAYYDCVLLDRVASVADGIQNPGFEEVAGEVPSAWEFWSRDRGGRLRIATDRPHSGQRCARLVYEGSRDWALNASPRFAVRPGEELCARLWVRGASASPVTLAVVGLSGGRVAAWNVGRTTRTLTAEWKELKAYAVVPEDVDQVYVRLVGRGRTDLLADDAALRHEKMVFPKRPHPRGWATARTEERVGRGVVALRTPQGVYIGWRLLKSDAADVAFDVYRRTNGRPERRLNPAPVRQTTDFIDADPPPEPAKVVYSVRPAGGAGGPSGRAVPIPAAETPYIRIPLKDPDETFQKVGIADLDGDGQYDYVIKQPNTNVDPWSKVWYASKEPYKIEAYRHDGVFLWRRDLGWAIETGIWYSPMIVFDLDGDGRAEVMVKVGEGDPRAPDGKVASGPEWLAVWDGMTGKELARVPWPSREGFGSYNHASRNQLAVAYLDGKTPCVLALRGTYGRMKVEAWQFHNGKLEALWKYDNEPYGARYWGQGAHFTLAADLDRDGRDEIVLGSAVLDDNGVPLWSTGRGHPDHVYLGDIDPGYPGWEVNYGMETAQRRGGIGLLEAGSGNPIWAMEDPNRHVHGKGMCADIDPLRPGLECYGADADGHKRTDRRWLFAADGTLLRRGRDCPWGFSVRTAFWDADLQKEIVSGRIMDYQGQAPWDRIEGRIVLIADVLGDWREEIVATVPGEMRIYTTAIPAMDRRTCLMQDRIYRMDTAMNAMGYAQPPMLSYCPEDRSPNLNLTCLGPEDDARAVQCRVVVSAPRTPKIRVNGVLELLPPAGVEVVPNKFSVNVRPGGRMVRTAAIHARGVRSTPGILRARLKLADGAELRAAAPFRLPSDLLRVGIIRQAEDFTVENGGNVHIRTDKPGVAGKALSHWDDAGHALSWKVQTPAGRYSLVFRYAAPHTARRRLLLDGKEVGTCAFPSSGGYGDNAAEWDHVVFTRNGRTVEFVLKRGEHTLKLVNTDGRGLNLDYLAFVPIPVKKP